MANADWSVDVDEPTTPPPRAERPRLVAAHTGLSPVQEAYGAWTRHQLACSTCRDIDAGPCSTAALLHRHWEVLAQAAVRRVADGSA